MLTKKKDLFAILSVIDKLGEQKVNAKFGYALIKNKAKVKEEVDAIREVGKPLPEYQKYESERIALCTEFADKNEDGSPKTTDNSFIISNKQGFDEKFVELKEKYKDVIAEQEKRMKDIETLIEEEIDIDWHRIKLEWLPDMPQSQLEVLIDMIDE